MTRHRRGGLADPIRFCDALRPARQACIDQLRHLEINGGEYAMMRSLIKAIDAAADLFTGEERHFVLSVSDRIGRNTDA